MPVSIMVLSTFSLENLAIIHSLSNQTGSARPSRRSGFTTSHASDPTTHRAAATRNAAVQPNWAAIQGVRDAVMAPAVWLHMFMTPETLPAEVPPRSAVTDQKELAERYSAPAPPARTTVASRASVASGPIARKHAASAMLAHATPQRPMRFP